MDPILIEVFQKKINLHDANTEAFFKITPDDPTWDAKRRASKIAFFAAISYGGGIQSIHRKILTEVPTANLTLEEFTDAIESWMTLHVAYREWRTKTEQQVLAKRFVITGFGRKRIFLGNDRDITREALNTLIQSSGASLINRAARRIWEERNTEKLKARFVAQIHDQLVMECPNDETETVKEMMIRQMSAPFEFRGVTRQIGVECSVGTDFSEL
jgi:DNA polymerase-1